MPTPLLSNSSHSNGELRKRALVCVLRREGAGRRKKPAFSTKRVSQDTIDEKSSHHAVDWGVSGPREREEKRRTRTLTMLGE